MARVPFPREAYYKRIGAADTLLPLVAANKSTTPGALGVNFLRNLILAQLSTIPFENVDAVLGRPISMHLDDIYNKLIHARRGGYCYEQNTLMRAALVDAGFTHIRTLGARVAFGDETSPTGQTHILNMVTIGDENPQRWLVEVGNASGPPASVIYLDTTESQFTPAGEFRVHKYDLCSNEEMVNFASPAGGFDKDWEEYSFEIHTHSGQWRAIHRFDLQPRYPRDVFASNYVTYEISVVCFVVRASRLVCAWAPEGTQNIPNGVGGFVCVPRGVLTMAVDTEASVAVRPLNAYPGMPDAVPPTGELAPCVPQEAHPTTADELYDWMTEHLGIDFAQSRFPQYNVTREEFKAAMEKRVVMFGGEGFKVPRY